jgi:hypothetical protein
MPHFISNIKQMGFSVALASIAIKSAVLAINTPSRTPLIVMSKQRRIHTNAKVPEARAVLDSYFDKRMPRNNHELCHTVE